jgi:hypothetical protein
MGSLGSALSEGAVGRAAPADGPPVRDQSHPRGRSTRTSRRTTRLDRPGARCGHCVDPAGSPTPVRPPRPLRREVTVATSARWWGCLTSSTWPATHPSSPPVGSPTDVAWQRTGSRMCLLEAGRHFSQRCPGSTVTPLRGNLVLAGLKLARARRSKTRARRRQPANDWIGEALRPACVTHQAAPQIP